MQQGAVDQMLTEHRADDHLLLGHHELTVVAGDIAFLLGMIRTSGSVRVACGSVLARLARGSSPDAAAARAPGPVSSVQHGCVPGVTVDECQALHRCPDAPPAGVPGRLTRRPTRIGDPSCSVLTTSLLAAPVIPAARAAAVTSRSPPVAYVARIPASTRASGSKHWKSRKATALASRIPWRPV